MLVETPASAKTNRWISARELDLRRERRAGERGGQLVPARVEALLELDRGRRLRDRERLLVDRLRLAPARQAVDPGADPAARRGLEREAELAVPAGLQLQLHERERRPRGDRDLAADRDREREWDRSRV